MAWRGAGRDWIIDRRAVLATIAVTVAAGCISNGSDADDESPDNESETMSSPSEQRSHEKIGSQLHDLTTADNPETYAEQRGIELNDGRVKVTIKLTSESAEVPAEASVTSRFQDLVDAWVHVDDVVAVANHDQVQFIQLAQESNQQSVDTGN